MQQYVIFNVLKEYCIPKEEEEGSRGGAHPVHAPPKIWKNMIFLRKIVIFHTKYPQQFSRLAPLGAIIFIAHPLTWNPGSAPAPNFIQ